MPIWIRILYLKGGYGMFELSIAEVEELKEACGNRCGCGENCGQGA